MITRRTLFAATAALGLVSSFGLATAQDMARSGTFTGASNHVTSGTATIIEEDGKFYVDLGADFSLDSGPDPRVGLGKDGYDPATHLGKLESLTGAQRYEIPASIDVAAYDEVYIWCEAASVPLGIAKLQ